MNQYPRWKNITILIVVLLSILYALPNLFGEKPALQIMSTKSGEKLDKIIINQAEGALKNNEILVDGIIIEEFNASFKLQNNEDQLKAKTILEDTLGPNVSSKIVFALS